MRKQTRSKIERLEKRLLLAAHTWTGGGSTADWSDAGNWAGGSVPAAAESGLTIDFPAGIANAATNNDISGLTIAGITCEDSYGITGQAITLNGTIATSGSGSLLVGTDIGLTSDATFQADAPMQIVGVISGSFGFSKTGSDTLTLNGINTYTGLTTVSSGTLFVNSSNALGDTSTGTVVDSGAAVVEAIGMNVPEPITINGGGIPATPGALRATWALASPGTSMTIWSGNVTLGSDATIGGSPAYGSQPASTLIVTGRVSGAGNLTLDGNGKVILSASTADTYSGSTTVNSGELWLEDSAVAVPGNLTINGGTVVVQDSEQITDSAIVDVVHPGELQLGTGVTETIGSLVGSGVVDGSGLLVDATTTMDLFTGQFNGHVSLDLSGPGRVTLTSSTASTSDGTLTLSSGQVNIHTDLSHMPLVQTGGEVFGDGTVASFTGTSGSVEPGYFTPSALHVAGDLDFTGSEFDFVATGDSTYEQLAAAGNVTLGGNLAMANVTYTPLAGKVFMIVHNTSPNPVSGIFTGYPEGHVFSFNGGDWKISYVGGDGNDVTLTYLGLPTTVGLTSAASPTPYGQVSLIATVSYGGAVPTGTVTFKEGSTIVGTANLDNSGIATLNAGTLAAGSHNLTATYNGNSVYEASPASTPYTQAVTRLSTTTTVGVTPVTGPYAQQFSLSATVTPAGGTGLVQFTANGTPVGTAALDLNGHATLVVANLPAGVDQIGASYAGDTNFINSAAAGTAGVHVLPTISVANATVATAPGATGSAVFTVSLDAASTESITVDYATADGTARAGSDYIAASGTVTFAPGQTSRTITVTIPGTLAYKPSESFMIALSNPANAVIGSAAATATIAAQNDGALPAGLISDPLNPAKTDYVVYGTAGNDTIQIKATKVPGQVLIKVNKTSYGPISPTGYVIVYGGAGNDHIVADARVSNNLMLFGGAGNDVLTGGAGSDILVGGDGNDVLSGGAGMNILIGGAGTERLQAGRFGDVLIGSATAYDAGLFSDNYALESLAGEWTSGAAYATRVAAMAGGVGLLGANFGPAELQSLSATDHLTGTSGRDLLMGVQNNKAKLRVQATRRHHA